MNQPTIQVAERFKATGPAAPTFVRWRAGARRESRVLPPLAGDHPAANRPCPACWIPLGDGRPVQLLAIGPIDDETRVQHAARCWYSALALLLHAECLGTAPAAEEAEPEPRFPYRQQAHNLCGSNSDRQSVGDPGHCEDCCSVGHVVAHPDLGCGDVGCYSDHGDGGPTSEAPRG